MVGIILTLLITPLAFAEYNPQFFYTAILEEQNQKDFLLMEQDYKETYKENKTGFVRIPPLDIVNSEYTMFSMVTEDDNIPFFKGKNKQMTASISDFFQLKSSNNTLEQNTRTGFFWEHFKTMTFGLVTMGKTADAIVKEKSKQKFVQVIKGCAIAFSDDCLVVRSGAGEEFEELYKLRIDILLEVDEEVENDKGEVWYKIKHEENIPHPERIKGNWFVPATHVRLIEIGDEPDFNTNKKIVVDISEQTLRAYEGDEIVIEDAVSTGLSGRHATPIGEFDILKKQVSRYMQAPAPGIQDWYDLPGVPFVMYFSNSGDALHCAYWHDKFGRRWSHGCINTSCETARLLYEWAATGTKMQVQW